MYLKKKKKRFEQLAILLQLLPSTALSFVVTISYKYILKQTAIDKGGAHQGGSVLKDAFERFGHCYC